MSYNYDKNNIDADAEHEAKALSKQGRITNTNNNCKSFTSRKLQRIRSEYDYNKVELDKLFRS